MFRMLAVFLLMAVGATYVTPLFPLYQSRYEMGDWAITLLFAVYALVLMPALLVAGSKAPSWGLKSVLRISICLSLISASLFYFSEQEWMLYAARAVEGLAYGAFTGSASAYLIEISEGRLARKALGYSGMTISFGFGLGPAVSGILIQYTGSAQMRLPFAVLAALLVMAAILLETLRSSGPAVRPDTSRISLGVPREVASRFWSMSALPVFLLFTLNGIVLSLIPTFAKTVLHTPNLAVAGVLIWMLLGGSVPAQWIGRPVNSRLRLVMGVLFLLIGTWLNVIAGVMDALALLWVGIAVQAVGTGWTFRESLDLAGRLPSADKRVKVISTFYLAAYAGFIVPVVGTGVLSSFLGLDSALFLLNVAATFVVGYVVAYAFRSSRSPSGHRQQGARKGT